MEKKANVSEMLDCKRRLLAVQRGVNTTRWNDINIHDVSPGNPALWKNDL